jgi:ABC-2 type transport system permease protein
MKQFAVLLKANFLLYVRNRGGVFWNLLMPVGLMLLFGLLYSSSNFGEVTGPNGVKQKFNYVTYMVPGLIVLSALGTGMIGFASVLATYREKGIFRRIRVTPLPIANFLVATVVIRSVIALLQAGIIIAVGIIVFGASFDWSGLPLGILIVLLICLVFVALGQLIASVVVHNETVSSVVQIVNLPLMLLGGLFIPLSQFSNVPVLPQLGSLLPTGVAVNVLRPTISPDPFKGLSDVQGILLLPVWVSLVVLVAYLIVSVAISARFFKWEVQ